MRPPRSDHERFLLLRVRKGKRTVVRYRIAVGIDDLVSGGKPGVALLPGQSGQPC